MSNLTTYLAYLSTIEGYGRKKLLEEYFKVKNQKTFQIPKEFLQTLHNIEIISFFDPKYPKLLKEIYDFPIQLFCLGNTELLKNTCVTIVGTRNMSKYGEEVIKNLLNIQYKEINIVSGLAKGVDSVVHRVSLERNLNTVAVVAGGIYNGYPKSNQDIFKEISNKGLVISEFAPERKIVKGMFPMRNRILSGLSVSTIVIESRKAGGSLITTRMALEQGRDVFAVPGNINKITSQGCNDLIKQGASPLTLDTTWEEILNLNIKQ